MRIRLTALTVAFVVSLAVLTSFQSPEHEAASAPLHAEARHHHA